MEQLDLLNLIQAENVIQKHLDHVQSLLEQGNITDLKVIAINKLYEFSFLGEKDGSIQSYSIYKKGTGIDLRNEGYLMYPFERVRNGTLNYILVDEIERGD
jgi:hypothetical protein